jgi:hypothetical protein
MSLSWFHRKQRRNAMLFDEAGDVFVARQAQLNILL